jgi:hypothetical protein
MLHAVSRRGMLRLVGGATRRMAVHVANARGCAPALVSTTKRHTVSTAQANPEEVWGWIVEMFAVNGDTNYGRYSPRCQLRTGGTPRAVRLTRRR